MTAVLVALLLAQEPGLLEADEPPPVDEPAPPPKPSKPSKRAPDAPLVIPPADGPVPPGVPVPDELPPVVVKQRAPDETRKLLLAERQELLDAMPGFVPPAIAAVCGGVAVVIGSVLGVLGGSGRADARTFYVGVPLGLLGLGGFVAGLVWARERRLLREPYEERIADIDQELGW